MGAASFFFFSFSRTRRIPKVHGAATSTCRGCGGPSVGRTLAVNGRCCLECNRLPPRAGGGSSRGPPDRKFWVSEGRGAGWPRGRVTSGLLRVHNHDRLGCPSRDLQFPLLTSFFINVLEGRGCGGSWLGEWLHKHFLNF